MAFGASRPSSGFRFDVFLSSTGGDFAGSLYDSLSRSGVRTFKEEERTAGQDRPSDQAMDGSDVFIAILSESYPGSRRCLRELAKMVASGRVILPVFLDVDPSDVRRQRGPLERAFREHERDRAVEKETVTEWREAMTAVGEIKGYHLTDKERRDDTKFIQLIVRDALSKLSSAPLDVAKYPVGIDYSVESIKRLLSLETEDVRMVGVLGMGGLGKTTLAKEAFNQVSQQFESSIFLSNIREVSRQPGGLVTLQNELISKIFRGKIHSIQYVDQGSEVIKQRIHSKKVLIVLDDVDDVDQLDALAGDRDWFRAGSRVIITTRDEHVLNVKKLKEHEIYRAQRLHFYPSLKLFSFYAFGRDQPPEEFMALSRDVVVAIDGLPLALIVVGSYLFDNRNEEDWRNVLKSLEHTPHEDVQQILQISYEKLDQEEKHIFLDLACFFIGMDREDAIHIWEGCGFSAKIAIRILLHKSLANIDESNKLAMHDQIRDLGRSIVEQENPTEPGMRSRLWFQEDVLNVLNNLKGTENVEGITLDFGKSIERAKTSLCNESLRPLTKLRLLKISNVNLTNGVKHIPTDLRWLQWQGCSMEMLPHNLNLKKLAVLDLSYSKMSRVWQEHCFQRKIVDGIKVLHLNHCSQLVVTPNFSRHPKLTKLTLGQCQSLISIHESIGYLKDLVSLDLSDCSSLKKVPNCIVKMRSLKILILSGCSKITSLPKKLGEIESLVELLLDGTTITHLPESIVQLQSLCRLLLNGCLSLKALPNSIGRLCSLKELSLDYTKIQELPDSVGSLKRLQELSARSCASLAILPHSIGQMKSLEFLLLDNSSIEWLPNTIGSLVNLKTLSIRRCKKLKCLPSSMGKMKNLCHIYMNETIISELPEDFGMLSDLRILEMQQCSLIKFIHGNFGDLQELRELSMRKMSQITMLPSSFSRLCHLEKLDASLCSLVERSIPSDFGNLTSLVTLDLSHNKFCSLPSSLSDLSKLEELSVAHCRELQSLPPLPSSLRRMSATNCTALQEIPDISNLKNLMELLLTNCVRVTNLVGHENLKCLRFLHLDGCRSLCKGAINRLSKVPF
ncbi:disease resistance protein RPV1-like [Nymphaea colorata]|nr:disease resistance protein RPV1-like [Nymphaea colorata]